MADILWGDFETYSEIDIKKQGGYRYAVDESTNIVCLGFALNDEPVQLWNPSKTMPTRIFDALANGALFYAHNAVFDYRIWNNCGVRDLDWPELDLDNVVDTSAVCASFSLPLALLDAGNAMSLKLPKDTEGKALIKLLCSPNKKGEQPMPFMPEYKAAFAKFFAYCKRDVESMRELIGLLPRNNLITKEKRVWRVTYNFNSAGLPVAYDEAKAIKEVIDDYCYARLPELSRITGGQVTTVNQHKRIKKYCNDHGYPMENTQAGTITEALDDPNCKGRVRELLALRNEIGSAATAKYKRLIELANRDEKGDYYLYDNLVYHGAGPGRWTGRGFQMHNLPRAKVKDPVAVINEYLAGTFGGNPVQVGKALIRPMIRAPKGFKIMVADYAGIENRVLPWFALDDLTLQGFRDGIDQYIVMAAARYATTYEAIVNGVKAEDTIAKGQRQMGKVIILGCGYMMGWETFIFTAWTQFGMVVTEEEAKAAVNAYREKYYLIAKLWKELKNAAARAVITGERQVYGHLTLGTSTVKGTRWLAMKLPSGKAIYYKNPKVEQKFIPKYESMGRVPTVTHEGRNPKGKKWMRLALTPGRITENAVQGTAREIMAQGMINVEDKMPRVIQIGTVHDESMALVPDDMATPDVLEEFIYHLCDVDFMGDCPLNAEGYIEERYKKD